MDPRLSAGLTHVGQIDWRTWRPEQDATLLFVVLGGRILLIHKKRGLGAGKINGPGGRIEPGESAREAAVREVREELCIEATGVVRCGELCFQFRDGLGLHVTVFTADGYRGTPTETGEARPLWFPVDGIPYEQMWQDDPVWMPHMLAGRTFRGRFLFDESRLLDYAFAAPAPSR
jgi:8-oxo-dGTP diphosphatase